MREAEAAPFEASGAPDGCPVYMGTDPYCISLAQCCAGGPFAACTLAHWSSYCEAVSATLAYAWKNALVDCVCSGLTPCPPENVPLTAAQQKLGADLCAACPFDNDNDCTLDALEITRAIELDDTIVTAIDQTCVPLLTADAGRTDAGPADAGPDADFDDDAGDAAPPGQLPCVTVAKTCATRVQQMAAPPYPCDGG